MKETVGTGVRQGASPWSTSSGKMLMLSLRMLEHTVLISVIPHWRRSGRGSAKSIDALII